VAFQIDTNETNHKEKDSKQSISLATKKLNHKLHAEYFWVMADLPLIIRERDIYIRKDTIETFKNKWINLEMMKA